ncbi:hypothetical protein [Gemmobacter caeruleus]|uniref:hypothetical protein n=1 Tax=Gemmobacter caeruleus TaxID=2595004 RepID=UPI0011ED31B1|nr:hypothetical protein [Gemmobacter caeruleus]
MIRPEALVTLSRYRDLALAATVCAAGLWLLRLGGWLFLPLGAALLALGAALGVIALRRLRFARPTASAGLIEVDEAQIGVFGPEGGGFVSLREMTELRLLSRGQRRFWRVKQTDGQALLIPVDAAGADRLFDAFATLPGMNSQALVAALDAPGGAEDTLGPVVWRRERAATRLGPA